MCFSVLYRMIGQSTPVELYYDSIHSKCILFGSIDEFVGKVDSYLFKEVLEITLNGETESLAIILDSSS